MTNDQKQRLEAIREGVAVDNPSIHYSRDLMHQDLRFLLSLIDEQERVLTTLPRTTDGVVITSSQTPVYVAYVLPRSGDVLTSGGRWIGDAAGTAHFRMTAFVPDMPMNQCYSTREAALEAFEAAQSAQAKEQA